MATVVDWDGKEIPKEMRSLPKGRYVLEPVSARTQLTPEQEAGLEEAMASLLRGEGVDIETIRSDLNKITGR